jgi:hypothetical protein
LRKAEKGPSCGCCDVTVSADPVKAEACEAVERGTEASGSGIGRKRPLTLAIDRNGKNLPVK